MLFLLCSVDRFSRQNFFGKVDFSDRFWRILNENASHGVKQLSPSLTC